MLSKPEYEAQIAQTRDTRMKWWRDARFGMFVHYGLYSQLNSHEWAMFAEDYEIEEYEKFADNFAYEKGSARKWAQLAKDAGMKYMVMTTRHHEGFSLWDSKVNPYNSVNYGVKIDVVREFVDACREFGLKIGFYSSLMDWHHPDGYKCAYDREARIRFTDYIKELNRELMTNYGKIDILWYDVPAPIKSWEGWNSLELNQMVRSLQPDIIIDDRSRLDEDFGTPEEHISPKESDWEACMTFNGLSWGYIDETQAKAYSYSPQQIIRMLARVTCNGGNLLLNIGPKPDGSIPGDVIEPLNIVGKWLAKNGGAVYGKREKIGDKRLNGVSDVSFDGKKLYLWNLIWPKNNKLNLGGVMDATLLSAKLLSDGTEVEFEQSGHRISLLNLPDINPDEDAAIPVFELVFDKQPTYVPGSYFPQMHGGKSYR
jgi:alpha-L-fucosidase